MARWASCSGPILLSIMIESLGRRYFTTKAVTPILLDASATALPSWPLANPAYPPPGKTRMAVPLAFPFSGRYGVMVGTLTSVIQSDLSIFSTYAAGVFFELGTPFGYKGIGFCCWAKMACAD